MKRTITINSCDVCSEDEELGEYQEYEELKVGSNGVHIATANYKMVCEGCMSAIRRLLTELDRGDRHE